MLTTPFGFMLHQSDQSRRLAGKSLAGMGFSPKEAPWREVYVTQGLRLRAYHEPGQKGPAVLLVPAPIKQPYIWDIKPGHSVVRAALRSHARVYLIDWQQPGEAEQVLGLDDYANRFVDRCVDSIQAEGGQDVVLIGHSLGGTLATIYTTLHPERVAGLILLEAPLEFEQEGGSLRALVGSSPPTSLMGPLVGNMPGVLMNAFSALGAPDTYVGERLWDFYRSLSDPEAFDLHMRVVRWTFDEMAMPRLLFEEVTERLYRRNALYRGELRLCGKHVHPQDLVSPLLAVVDPGSTVIPPGSVLRFMERTGSRQQTVIEYAGDHGVAIQHVGVLLGSNAHQYLWPAVLRWIHALDSSVQASSPQSDKNV